MAGIKKNSDQEKEWKKQEVVIEDLLKSGKSVTAAETSYNAAISFFKEGDYEGAKIFFEKAIDIYSKENEVQKSIMTKIDYGEFLIYIKEYSDAVPVFDEAKDLAQKSSLIRLNGLSTYHLGNAHYKNGRRRKALSTTEEALLLAEKDKNDPLVLKCYKLLEEISADLGRKEDASLYFHEHLVK